MRPRNSGWYQLFSWAADERLATDGTPVPCREAFPGPVDLDLGNLMAYEPRGPPEAELKKDATAACIAHGRDVLQKLVVRSSGVSRPAAAGCAAAENGALWRR